MVPFTIATGTMKYAQNLLIRVHTDDGMTGVGECSAFPMIAGETQSTCFELAKDFAALWKNKSSAEIDNRLDELDAMISRNFTAKSAFDMALYDLTAKRTGQPLYQYLGGTNKTLESDLTIGIGTPEEMAAYRDAWLEEAPDDVSGIAKALGDIARAKGMTQVALDAGLSRESLYRALSADGNPSFATVLKVARALGVKFHAEPA